MKQEIEYSLQKLNSAFASLEEGALQAHKDLEIDGVIQRFEFTFELLWKTIKLLLKHEGIICKSPRETFKEAFKLGWLADDRQFLRIMDDRNASSHTYNFEESRIIFERIKGEYLIAFGELIENLELKSRHYFN